jgi:WD40 repeat protein
MSHNDVSEGSITLWRQQEEPARKGFGEADGDDADLEAWSPISVLSQPTGIFDLAWSPCGEYLASASDMDNAARIWHVSSRMLF